jgi:protein-S-isoprenylcysteine O-methyltransferase Ste14
LAPADKQGIDCLIVIEEKDMTDHAASNLADHAGVRVPPPLIYLVLFGLGLLLHQIVPISFLPVMPARVAALICLGYGVLLVGWSNLLFRRAHTSLVPIKPSTALVVRGPYRLTRNPMYLGLLYVYIALALWLGVVWPLILVPLLVLAVQRLAIAKEERYLEQKFGDAYRQYRAHVRRWI